MNIEEIMCVCTHILGCVCTHILGMCACVINTCPHAQFWFAGDTGYCNAFKKIGAKHGPIDLSAIPIGAYSPRSLFRKVHMNPEEAIVAHMDVQSVMSVAMHHSTFQVYWATHSNHI